MNFDVTPTGRVKELEDELEKLRHDYSMLEEKLEKAREALKEISEYSCTAYGAHQQLGIAVRTAYRTLRELQE